MADPLADLSAHDVSIWLDDISRERLRTGNLKGLVDSKHVVGVTSNPTIFQKALEKGDAYDDQVRDLRVRQIAVDGAIRYLMAFDIRWACDVLRPTFDRTAGKDGRVSSQADPPLRAHTTRKHATASRRGLRSLALPPSSGKASMACGTAEVNHALPVMACPHFRSAGRGRGIRERASPVLVGGPPDDHPHTRHP